jgi:PAP2 superfamily
VATGIGALVVAGLTALSAEIYEEVVEQQGVTPLDRTVLEWVAVQRSPRMDEAITWFTDLGGPMWMTVLTTVAVLAVTAVWRSWSPVVLVLIAAGGSLSMTVVGKDATGRTRPPAHLAVPPLESSASLPSGHTLNAVAICGMLAYLLLRRQRSASGRVVTVCIAVSFAVRDGVEPGLPRSSLAHRCRDRVDHRARLADRRGDRSPAVPDRAPSAPGSLTRSALMVLRRCGSAPRSPWGRTHGDRRAYGWSPDRCRPPPRGRSMCPPHCAGRSAGSATRSPFGRGQRPPRSEPRARGRSPQQACRFEEPPDERNPVLVHAQSVGIGYAAGQHQSVERGRPPADSTACHGSVPPHGPPDVLRSKTAPQFAATLLGV